MGKQSKYVGDGTTVTKINDYEMSIGIEGQSQVTVSEDVLKRILEFWGLDVQAVLDWRKYKRLRRLGYLFAGGKMFQNQRPVGVPMVRLEGNIHLVLPENAVRELALENSFSDGFELMSFMEAQQKLEVKILSR